MIKKIFSRPKGPNHSSFSGILIFLTFSLITAHTGCKKFVEADPPVTSLVSESVYTDNGTAASAVTAIYGSMSNTGFSDGPGSISYRMGLYSDELTKYTNDQMVSKFYANSLLKTDDYFFTELYKKIYITNAAIDGLTKSSTLTPTIKSQLLGEAKFMRAFFYFYAVNLFGDVPLTLTSNYQENNLIGRSSKNDVYKQITIDLQDAQSLLPVNYLNSTGASSGERIRPTKGAANGLLARVYLYTNSWSQAEEQATAVIANKTLYDTVALNTVFKKNNKEAIFQLQPIVTGTNTLIAANFVFAPNRLPGGSLILSSISPQLKDAFERNDKRWNEWIGSYTDNSVNPAVTYYFPYKYRINVTGQPISEYMNLLRLGEQYLIRAEARVMTGNIEGAKQDINVIRRRAGLDPTNAASPDELLTAIAHERQVELFTEWGDRWFDLVRTKKASGVMKVITPSKGGSWDDYKMLLPILQGAIKQDPSIQNPGY